MNESKITVRYAKALFALAKEGNSLEAVKKDMIFLQQCISEVPELHFVIQSPVIKVSEKIRLFEEAFRDAFHTLTASFIRLILEKRREEYLAGISRYFISLIKKGSQTVTHGHHPLFAQNRGIFYFLPVDEKIPLGCLSTQPDKSRLAGIYNKIIIVLNAHRPSMLRH